MQELSSQTSLFINSDILKGIYILHLFIFINIDAKVYTITEMDPLFFLIPCLLCHTSTKAKTFESLSQILNSLILKDEFDDMNMEANEH
jgi:hypothetical protein